MGINRNSVNRDNITKADFRLKNLLMFLISCSVKFALKSPLYFMSLWGAESADTLYN